MAEQKENKPVAVITGASKGIGLAASLKFIELGYTVIGCARSKDKMTELQTKYPSCSFSPIDVTNAKEVESWSKTVIDKYGSPDILINNAGVACDKAPIEDVSIKNLDLIIDVNIKGVMYTIKYFMPAMKANKDKQSKIISISSPSGRIGIANMSPYCASKWAIEGLMLSIAKEVPEYMTAIAYNPGGIITEMIYCLMPELNGKIDECIKLGAIGPKQWADVCVPHIIGMKREDVNGKPIDRPNLKELLSNNWKIYRQIKQQVLDEQAKK
eukprot:CAMPEP_0201572962 /NCGR_PEP_ID=MMETSP0190_2-20130828/16543_1 /ASSEMBLY_ACC=CAM_ASM_000263 /TAXON_ID=37353 /ORGANISM="Rosalina sp." /LENGTH=269 /DNA_ID=CAMNT_0047999365 /DNA_START=32 /DNA_END=841 /DNA_ORIENTATION=-